MEHGSNKVKISVGLGNIKPYGLDLFASATGLSHP